MFNDNQEFIEAVAKVMYDEWLASRKEQGYHHGMEHQDEDSWCDKCDGKMVEWTFAKREVKLEYERMARAAITFLNKVRYY
jgi:hypothetical protein